MKKMMLDIESTINGHVLVTSYAPKASGILGAMTPKQEPEKRSFDSVKEFTKWIETEIGRL